MRSLLLLALAGCSTRDAGEVSLRRLTPAEYNATVRDLYGMGPEGWYEGVEIDWEADFFTPPWPYAFAPDLAVGGFEGMAEGQVVSPVYAEQIEAAAAHFATYAPLAPRFWTCDPVPADGDARRTCARDSVQRLARRAWRRPLTDDERARVDGAFSGWDAQYGTDTAVVLTAQALLQTPQFLYRVEADTRPGAELDGYALASRLSYFLWDSMPDDALFVAAEKGRLGRTGAAREEASRMLHDPRAREMVTRWHRQWLELDGLQRTSPSLDAYGERYVPQIVAPGFDPLWAEELWSAFLNGTRGALLAEVDLFVEHTIFESSGTLTELLTSRKGWQATVRSEDIDGGTSDIYGASTPRAGEDAHTELEDGNFWYGVTLTPVEHPEGQRAGVLTLGAVLATRAHPVHPAPVLRGVFTLERLICQDLGSPPDGAALTAPPDSVGADATNRDRLEALTGQAPCNGCHRSINPLGYAFESYDALGGWRTTDNGRPVDPSGVLLIPREPDRPFADAVELAGHLAASDRVHDCYATQWARVATGDPEVALDDPRFAKVRERFRQTDSIPELLLDLTTTDAFRSRGVAR